MILYKSTRGDKKVYTFSEVILKGIARDGGLFIPLKIPKFTLDDLRYLSNKSYQEKALFIFKLFETDFGNTTLKEIIKKAYSSSFDNSQIVPLIHLKDSQYILELFHGPTSAFKDMALQIMPLFFSESLKKSPHKYIILVATSGDTGKAALEGYKNKKGVKIIVFYPIGGVSILQELQMTTQEGNNLAVIGVKGNFDDVQKSVKEVFADKKFQRQLLDRFNVILSSANSINWGRLLPQIIYYVSSYLDLVNQKIINFGDDIDIAVPTGNFGNILAAFYAKKMGVPIKKLICASNENNILTEFLQTGIYDISDRSLIKTPSPSMDIIIAGNNERLLFEITKDPEKVARWMKQLKEDKQFVVDAKTRKVLQSIFYADWVSNEDCLKVIKKIYNEIGYLMDPHTAVAQVVAKRYQTQYKSIVPIIICSTAHWAKFPKDVYKALTGIISVADDFKILSKITQLIPSAIVPKNIRELRNKKVRNTGKCDVGKEAVEEEIFQYLTK